MRYDRYAGTLSQKCEMVYEALISGLFVRTPAICVPPGSSVTPKHSQWSMLLILRWFQIADRVPVGPD